MAEPIRRAIVEMLASGEHTAGNIEEIITRDFGVGRPAVHHHLALMREHGWLIVRDEWPNHWYRLDERVVLGLESAVRRVRRRWNRRIGWIDGAGYHVPTKWALSNRGRRGHGRDPDDPWWVKSD